MNYSLSLTRWINDSSCVDSHTGSPKFYLFSFMWKKSFCISLDNAEAVVRFPSDEKKRHCTPEKVCYYAVRLSALTNEGDWLPALKTSRFLYTIVYVENLLFHEIFSVIILWLVVWVEKDFSLLTKHFCPQDMNQYEIWASSAFLCISFYPTDPVVGQV